HKSESGTSGVASVEAQIYCEEIKFSYPNAVGGGAAAPDNGASTNASDPAVVLASALTQFLGTRLDASTGAQPVELVAARLRGSASGEPAAPDNPRSVDHGRKLGVTWASQRATLPELEQVAETRDREWTALVLPVGNSLLAYLQEAAVVPTAHDGPL